MSDAENTILTKVCKQCGEDKPVSEFNRDYRKKEGYRPRCRKCYSSNIDKEHHRIVGKAWAEANKELNSSYKKAWAEANKERLSAERKLWRLENKDKIADYHKEYYEANKETLCERAMEYREQNKEHLSELARKYYLDNSERIIARSRQYYIDNAERISDRSRQYVKDNPDIISEARRNRRARKKLAVGTHTKEDINNLLNLQKKKCAVCKKPISDCYHVDHVVALSKGGSNDRYNLQLLCPPCNLSKHDKDPIDFMQSRGKLL